MTYVEAIEQVLVGKKSSMWGRAWSIDQPADRKACAEWIAETVLSPVLEMMETVNHD